LNSWALTNPALGPVIQVQQRGRGAKPLFELQNISEIILKFLASLSG